MMAALMKLRIELMTNNVTLEQWRAAYHSPAFNCIVAEQTKLRERTVVEQNILPDGKEQLKIRVVPDISLPGPVLKLVGEDEIAYTEVTTFDPRTKSTRLDIESKADKSVRVGGDVSYQVEGSGIRMRFDGKVEVKVFALGGLIERLIASEVRKRYGQIEPLLQRFVDEQRFG